MAQQNPDGMSGIVRITWPLRLTVGRTCDLVVVVRICPVPFLGGAIVMLEVAGSWWTPTTLDHKVPGILTSDPQKAGRLTLIGGLRTPEGTSYGRSGFHQAATRLRTVI
jgi:hypothetical protein